MGRNERRNPGARGHRGAWVVEMIETLKRRKVEAERSLKFEVSLGYTGLRPCLKKTKKQKTVYTQDRPINRARGRLKQERCHVSLRPAELCRMYGPARGTKQDPVSMPNLCFRGSGELRKA